MILHGRRLSRLLEDAGVRTLREPGADPEIRGICLDSRRAGPGYLFCALVGLKTDGTDFIPEALRRGARAVLSESPRPGSIESEVAWLQVAHARRATGLLAREWHGRPDEGLTLVGITGTNGKTSVVYLLEAIARAAGRRPGRIGTVAYAYRNMEWPAKRTTPEAPAQAQLRVPCPAPFQLQDGAVAALGRSPRHYDVAIAAGRHEDARH